MRYSIWHILLMTAFLACTCMTVNAQDVTTAAGDVNKRHEQAASEQKREGAEIAKKRKKLQQKLARLQDEVAKEQKNLAADKAEVKALAAKRDDLQHEIATRLASKEELDNIFLDHTRNFLSLTEDSPSSSQEGERLDQLKGYLTGNRIFDLEDMTRLLAMYFDDIETGKHTVKYQGKVLDRSGEDRTADIIRFGHMSALFSTEENNGFLSFSPGSRRLLMSGDPGFFTGRDIASFFADEANIAPIDISGGAAISQLARKESLEDRLRSGGILVIPILLVGLAAIIIALERLFFLSRVRSNTDALMTRVTELVFQGDFEKALQITIPHKNRPTGKVLMAGLVHKNEKHEVIESVMSEAILTQIPRLERFIGALKVLAAVAPLLGLLGTVTGMINTFQVITTHGTGDPRLMAGGISEAMVTTQVGLAVAIPIMMVASFLGGRVKNIARDMEEKGIALMGAMMKHNGNHA
ncbi:MAG: MotA [Desulfobacterales bacterium]|nr:MAG: MotA [Desulfobacterales bacterium]